MTTPKDSLFHPTGLPQYEPPRPVARPKPLMFWVLLVTAGILLMTALGLGFSVIRKSLPGLNMGLPGAGGLPSFGLVGSPGEKIVLMMGVDENIGQQKAGHENTKENGFKGTRTDTMMLVRLSPKSGMVSLVSIPRDSKVYLAENRGIDKINAAYAYGGPEMALHTVQDAFGIPVDNYVVVNYQGVRELVDAIGGIDLFIEKPMHYRDRTAKLNIAFDKGNVHLDGTQAEAFLRFRHDELGDIGRIRRQQQFVAAVSQKLKNPLTLAKLPSLVDLTQKYVQTDMSNQELMRLAWFMKEIDIKNMQLSTLPGHASMEGGISYWIIDPKPAQELLDRVILDNPVDAFLGREPDEKGLQVGLVYVPDQAKRLEGLEKALTDAGFKVACKTQRRNISTQLVQHTQRMSETDVKKLRTVAPGLGNARLIFAPVGTTYETNQCSGSEDATVVVGDNF